MKIDRRVAGALIFWLTWPLRGRLGLSYVYHYDLRRPVTPFRADIRVEICRATMSDVEEAALLPASRDRERFNGRLDNGNACFVAKADGRVVAFNWTRFSSGSDDGCAGVLGPAEIYTSHAFTAQGYRGRKIHTETLAYMLHAAKTEGYRDAYTMVSVQNRASRKTMDRLGWRLSGRVVRLRVRRSASFVVLAFSGSRRPLGGPAFGAQHVLEHLFRPGSRAARRRRRIPPAL
jgi:GNAT superfamily N-acetyltransferase